MLLINEIVTYFFYKESKNFNLIYGCSSMVSWKSFAIYLKKELIQKIQVLVSSITDNYIIKYLIFYIESAFYDRINGTQFYRDQ